MLNKEVYINRRKKLKENFRDGLILIMGNNFSPLDCEDNTYPFIQDATFKYYFGMDHNGLIGIIDIDNDEEIIFGNDYTMSDIIWMGKQKFLKELALEVGIEKFIEKEELKKYLENRKNIRFTNQYKADNIMYLSSILNINPFEFDKYTSFDLVKAIIKQRNIKDKIEIEEIEKEVRDLVNVGYKEVILTGIHISSYGLDFEEKIQLIELVERVAKVAGVERLRISSLEPRIITEEFVERLSKLDNFCPHFHLSLQSGSDNTLKAMSRRYDASEFKEGVRLIRKYFDMPALTTDIIAGFPGETEDDFTESLEYIRDIGFFELHVFPYSKREGTKAASMKETLSNKDKTRRVNLLLSMQEPIRRKFLEEKIGKEVEVLIESEFEHENKRYVLGHSKEYIKVALPYIEKARNMIIPAKLISFIKDDIILGEELKQ